MVVKVQSIKHKRDATEQLFVTVPVQIATAAGIGKGQEVEWEPTDQGGVLSLNRGKEEGMRDKEQVKKTPIHLFLFKYGAYLET